jgi:SanA protein
MRRTKTDLEHDARLEMTSRWVRRVLRACVVGAVVLVTAVVAANVVVVTRTSDAVTSDFEDLDPAQAVIVPGSHVRDDGSLGSVVAERVEAAVALYQAGVVEKVLVSGDNGTACYNETDAMRDAVLASGVPPADVFTDYAGFSTWHTMSRAREVFGVESAVIVTQQAYVARAVDLGVAAGMDTQGYVTREGGGRRGRELVARVRGLAEATWRPGVVGGPMIPIAGDGRASWADDADRQGRAGALGWRVTVPGSAPGADRRIGTRVGPLPRPMGGLPGPE